MSNCPVPLPNPQAPAQGSEWERMRGTYGRPPGYGSSSQCRHLPGHRGRRRPGHWHTLYQSQPQSSYQTGKLRSSAWEARGGGTGRIGYAGRDGSHCGQHRSLSTCSPSPTPQHTPTLLEPAQRHLPKTHYGYQLQKTGRAGL